MSGMIEACGRGFDKIKEACARYDGPLPEYDIKKSGIMVLCKACEKYISLLKEMQGKPDYLGQNDQDSDQDVTKIICDFCRTPHSAKEIMEHIHIQDRSFFRRHYLESMLKADKLKRTIPDKPQSRYQKYYSV